MANISVFLRMDDESMGLPVELLDGSPFPARFEAWASVGGEVSLDLWIVVEDGRPVLDAVQFSRSRGTSGPVKTLAPRDLDEVVAQAVQDMGRYMEKAGGRARPSGVAALRAYGHRPVGDDLLREVAAIVRADLDGQPNKAIVTRFNVSSRTASRWIKAAENYITEED